MSKQLGLVLVLLDKWRAKLQQHKEEKSSHLSIDTFTFMEWFSSGNLTRSLKIDIYMRKTTKSWEISRSNVAISAQGFLKITL